MNSKKPFFARKKEAAEKAAHEAEAAKIKEEEIVYPPRDTHAPCQSTYQAMSKWMGLPHRRHLALSLLQRAETAHAQWNDDLRDHLLKRVATEMENVSPNHPLPPDFGIPLKGFSESRNSFMVARIQDASTKLGSDLHRFEKNSLNHSIAAREQLSEWRNRLLRLRKARLKRNFIERQQAKIRHEQAAYPALIMPSETEAIIRGPYNDSANLEDFAKRLDSRDPNALADWTLLLNKAHALNALFARASGAAD